MVLVHALARWGCSMQRANRRADVEPTAQAPHNRLGRMTDVEFDAFIKQDKRGGTYTIPEPFFVRDEVLGYSAREGLYRFVHSGKKKGRFVVNATVLEDGSRATSYAGANLDAQRRVYIFGDSYIWGWGVNDHRLTKAHCFTNN